LTQAIYRILYWKGIRKWQASRKKISGEVLQKRAKQGSKNFSTEHLQLMHPVVTQKIKIAMQKYTQIKKQSNQRDTWLGKIIVAQAEDKNIPKKRLWQRVRQTEQSRQTAQGVKQALGKLT